MFKQTLKIILDDFTHVSVTSQCQSSRESCASSSVDSHPPELTRQCLDTWAEREKLGFGEMRRVEEELEAFDTWLERFDLEAPFDGISIRVVCDFGGDLGGGEVGAAWP